MTSISTKIKPNSTGLATMADGAAPISTAGRGDRLTALDDDLLHKIITHLPVTEAARTVALAKRWRHLWSSTPLVLYDGDLIGPGRDALVCRVLREHPGHFRSVRLTDCRLDSMDRELPGWPLRLADKNTQRLDLVNGFIPDQDNTLWRIPADVLRCESLEELLLGYWAFPRRADIVLPRLRCLSLLMVVISDEDLEHLINACPVLEILKLNGGRPKNVRLRSRSLRCALVGLSRVQNFMVVDAPLLERLVLFSPGNGVRVKIGFAANLRVLGHLDTRAHRLQIGDIVIEVQATSSLNLKLFPSTLIRSSCSPL